MAGESEIGKTFIATLALATNLDESIKNASKFSKWLSRIEKQFDSITGKAKSGGGFGFGGGSGGGGGGPGGGRGGGGQSKEERDQEAAMRRSHAIRVRERVSEGKQVETQVRNALNRDRRMERRLELREEAKQVKEDNQMSRTAKRYVTRDIRAQNRHETKKDLDEEKAEAAEVANKRLNLRTRVRDGQRRIREEKRAADRAEAITERQQRAGSRAELQTLSMLGAGGVAGRIGQYRAYGSLMSSAGYAGAGAAITKLAAPVGLAIGAGKFGLDTAKTAADADVNAFADSGQKNRQFLNDMFPTVRDYYMSLSGQRKDTAWGERVTEANSARMRGDQSRFSYGMNYRSTSDPYQSRAAAFSDYKVVGLPSANRFGTAKESLDYRQQLRMMEPTQNLLKAEKELAAARMNTSKALDRSIDTEQHYWKTMRAGNLSEISERYIQDVSQRNNQTMSTVTLRDIQASANEDRKKAVLEHQGAKAGEQGAYGGMIAAEITKRKTGLGNLEERVGLAETGARNLGGMNLGNRMRGKMAFEMFQKNPELIQFASPEMVGAARESFPEAMRAMELQLGKKITATDPAYEQSGDPHYPAGGLDAMAREARKELGDIAGEEVGQVKQDAAAMARIYAPEFVKEMLTIMREEVKIEVDKQRAAGQASVAKSQSK